MASLKNKTESIERRNNASPLADDLLSFFQQEIEGGNLGAGVGPLQRQAGTAAQQFVNSGGGQFDISPLFEAFQAQSDRGTKTGLRDLREGFGIAGNRFGTGFGAGSAQFGAQRQADLDAFLGKLSLDTFNSEQSRLLQGIELLGNLGTQALEPFLRLGERGILEPKLVEKKGIFGTIGDIAGAIPGIGGAVKTISGAVSGGPGSSDIEPGGGGEFVQTKPSGPGGNQFLLPAISDIRQR